MCSRVAGHSLSSSASTACLSSMEQPLTNHQCSLWSCQLFVIIVTVVVMVMLVWALCLETEQHLEEVDPEMASQETKISFNAPWLVPSCRKASPAASCLGSTFQHGGAPCSCRWIAINLWMSCLTHPVPFAPLVQLVLVCVKTWSFPCVTLRELCSKGRKRVRAFKWKEDDGWHLNTCTVTEIDDVIQSVSISVKDLKRKLMHLEPL